MTWGGTSQRLAVERAWELSKVGARIFGVRKFQIPPLLLPPTLLCDFGKASQLVSYPFHSLSSLSPAHSKLEVNIASLSGLLWGELNERVGGKVLHKLYNTVSKQVVI